MTSQGHEIIDRVECDILLRGRTLGRVGVKFPDELVILPVFYAFVDGDIVFRADPGKLDAVVLATRVRSRSTGWPRRERPLVGHARGVRNPVEQQHARTRIGHDWPEGERDRIVAIRAKRVTGRDFPVPAEPSDVSRSRTTKVRPVRDLRP